MKEIKNPNVTPKDFQKEIDLQNFAAQKGIAPKIHYVNKRRQVFVMDALVQDFRGFVEEQLVSNDLTQNEKKQIMLTNVTKILKLIKKLHRIGMVHGDIHGGNIMRDNDGQWFLIDYGLSQQSTNRDLRRADLEELWNVVYAETLTSEDNKIKPLRRKFFVDSLKLMGKELGINWKKRGYLMTKLLLEKYLKRAQAQ